MFYKVMWNNMVIDLLQKVCYVRYLPGQQRFIQTDESSANAIIGSDGNSFYHLIGSPNTFDKELKSVSLLEISKEEYFNLQSQVSYQKQQTEDLQKKVASLEELVNKQNALLEQLLTKLN